jgi:glycosyltransferase involved in cell wall biosynthesis
VGPPHYSQDNKGPSNAINQGIQRATRPLIKLVGGDDLLHPDATRLLHDHLIAENAVYAFGKLDAFDTNAEIEDEAYWSSLMPGLEDVQSVRIDDPLRFLIKGMMFNPSCVLLRRSDVIAAGGSDESVFVEDFSLSLRMALRGPFVSVPVYVAYGPAEDEKRLSHDGAQTLHDMNAALAGIIRDYPDLPRYRKNMIAQCPRARMEVGTPPGEQKRLFEGLPVKSTREYPFIQLPAFIGDAGHDGSRLRTVQGKQQNSLGRTMRIKNTNPQPGR